MQSQNEHNKSIIKQSPVVHSEYYPDGSDDVQADILHQMEAVENDSVNLVTDIIPAQANKTSPEIDKLTASVSKKIEERNNDPGNTLPDVPCVRQYHNLLALLRGQDW